MEYKWYEITGKDWDKLTESTREIFLTPTEGDKQTLTYAGRGDVLDDYNIKAIRQINC